MATLLDGRKISAEIKAEIAEEVASIKAQGGKIPHLAAVLVGNDGASETYVNAKVKACEEVGFKSTELRFDATISEEDLLQVVDELNDDADIDGFIVQLPLPEHISVERVIESINPQKDVDGFHPVNVGRMVKNLPAYISATPYGILELLRRSEIETKGKHCVVVGRSQIVGSPMSILMAGSGSPGNCTVTLCHRHTKNLEEHTRLADILIVAVGIPGLIKADMVKEGAVVIDVGITRVEDAGKKKGYALKGDVDFEGVASKCSHITPVPGGVGPMTIGSLLWNTLLAAKNAVYKGVEMD
jgi:methylenetetrahydrofolate dehydrogenase (NADP+) / methenyltetrahydrofolate cyclohydrolase